MGLEPYGHQDQTTLGNLSTDKPAGTRVKHLLSVVNEANAGSPASDTDAFQRNQYELLGSDSTLPNRPLRGFVIAGLGSVLREVTNEGSRQT